MSLRVLVIEDNEVIYQDYLIRLFEELISMEEFEFTRMGTIQSALEALEEDWPMIFVDHNLGSKFVKREDIHFRNGADLIAYRRVLEEADPDREKAFIMGISESTVLNNRMISAGADGSCLKLRVEAMVSVLKEKSKRSKPAAHG